MNYNINLKYSEYPMVSVVILNYNGKKYLGDILDNCIKSVLNSSYPKIEVIIVDNASTDGSIDHLKNIFKNNNKIKYKLLKNNYGMAKGNNEGIKVSKGDYILLLNSDTFVPRETIEKMVEVMLDNSNIGALGCKILNPDGSTQSTGEDLRKLFRSISKNRNDKKSPISGINYVDWIIGAAMMLKKSILQNTGIFYEYYWAFYEEIDLCYRIKQLDYDVACYLDTTIIHYGNLTAKHFDKWRTDLQERNRMLFHLKNFSWLHAFMVFCLNFLGVILLLTHQKAQKPPRFYKREWTFPRQRAKSKLKAFLYINRDAEAPYRISS